MAWNEPYNRQEAFYITEPKRIINMSKKYHPGSGDLLVFYNGVLAIRDVQYKEVNAYTIEFLFDLGVEDTVICQLQKLW